MHTFLDINNIFRKRFSDMYDKFGVTKLESFVYKMVSYVKSLKEDNFELYKYMVGLMLVDDYKLLIYDNKNDEELLQTLEMYNSLNGMDEFLAIIEEDDTILYDMGMSSVLYYNSDPIEKAEMLVLLSDEMITEFNKFTYFERYNSFQSKTIEEIHNIYNSHLAITKKGINDEESVGIVTQTLLILSVGNMTNFELLILKMMKDFYKWNKSKQIKKLEIDNNIKFLIDVIEKDEISDLIDVLCYEEGFLGTIVGDYFKYYYDYKNIDKDEVEKIYETKVDDKIKKKLKEV